MSHFQRIFLAWNCKFHASDTKRQDRRLLRTRYDITSVIKLKLKLIFKLFRKNNKKKKKNLLWENILRLSRRNIFQVKIKFPPRGINILAKGKARDRCPVISPIRSFNLQKGAQCPLKRRLWVLGVSLHLPAITYYRIMNRSALLCVTLTFNYTMIRFSLQPFRGEREMEINRDQIRGWTDVNIERYSRDEVYSPRWILWKLCSSSRAFFGVKFGTIIEY